MLKLTFLKNSLVAAINIVMKAVPTRTSLPILECILIEAFNGTITMTSRPAYTPAFPRSLSS